ncbi:MAG: large-conductance mechanosensitive channel protein MscL [Clostridiales bacterium]|nr:large-conductance mechanosensitive channel protein MscL [Candidatus Blautia equi]
MEKKGIIAEFKEFISRGNVMDLAVGMIIGSAFTAIVNSLVNDVVMPAIGMVIGNNSFENFKYVIKAAEGDNPESAIYYGTFIQNIVNFLLIAVVVFMLVKGINALRKKKEEAPAEEPAPAEPTPVEINNDLLKENTKVLQEIRDALNKK